MFLSTVSLQNFRNILSLGLEFNQGFIVLAGPNGAGKTNFLEAIYFGASLRRFPESRQYQLFQEEKNFLRVRLTSGGGEERTQEVLGENHSGRYTYQLKVNNLITPRKVFTGTLPAISFLPQDLNLLTRSPGNRRRYLNETLSLVSTPYRHFLLQYQQVLRQRNQILQKLKEQGREVVAELEVWDEKLAEAGSFLIAAREEFLDYLNLQIFHLLREFSPDLEEIKFFYLPSGAETKAEFLQKLEGQKEEEKKRGMTLLGPHRDDFLTKLGQKEAVGFISRGQLRSITLALKIAEKQYVSQKTGKDPILLLDDVFSEFDRSHQKRLIEFFKSFGQVFFTTTHLEEIQKFLPDYSQVFEARDGSISKETTNV